MSKARGLADLGNVYSDGALSNRTVILNGAMNVAQRGTSVTGVNSTGYYTVDRFRVRHDTSSTSTLEQSSDAPEGFNNSFKLTTTTAGSIGADQSLRIDHMLESGDLQRLKFGTSNAETFTVSFWVKSSIAGNYSFNVYQYDGGKQVNDTYTINSANTWEHKSITFIGNTVNAIASDNSRGFELSWLMAAGSNLGTTSQVTTWTDYTAANFGAGQAVDISGTLNATFQITGVQLEIGDTATPFEHRSYSDQLQSCQRYFQKITSGNLRFIVTRDNNSGSSASTISLPVGLRASPTVSGTSTKVAAASGGARGSGPSNLRGWDANSPSQISIGASSGLNASTEVTAFWFNTDIDAEL